MFAKYRNFLLATVTTTIVVLAIAMPRPIYQITVTDKESGQQMCASALILPGDVDFNGKLNDVDEAAVVQAVASQFQYEVYPQYDLNGDLKINVADENIIRRYSGKYKGETLYSLMEKGLGGIGEAGKVEFDSRGPHLVLFSHAYENPVVFAFSNVSGKKIQIQVTHVEHEGFTFKAFGEESSKIAVRYFVFEAGSWVLDGDGTEPLIISVGSNLLQDRALRVSRERIVTKVTGTQFQRVPFVNFFGATPVLFSQIQNGGTEFEALSAVFNVDSKHFELGVAIDLLNPETVGEGESIEVDDLYNWNVGWLAISSTAFIQKEWSGVKFISSHVESTRASIDEESLSLEELYPQVPGPNIFLNSHWIANESALKKQVAHDIMYLSGLGQLLGRCLYSLLQIESSGSRTGDRTGSRSTDGSDVGIFTNPSTFGYAETELWFWDSERNAKILVYDVDGDGDIDNEDLRQLTKLYDQVKDNPLDINKDGKIDLNDYQVFLDNIGTDVVPGTNGDVNGDGRVDENDYYLLEDELGESTVPEPKVVGLELQLQDIYYIGESSYVTAVAILSNGTTKDVTSSITLSSSNTDVLSVDSGGHSVTAQADGSASLSASLSTPDGNFSDSSPTEAGPAPASGTTIEGWPPVRFETDEAGTDVNLRCMCGAQACYKEGKVWDAEDCECKKCSEYHPDAHFIWGWYNYDYTNRGLPGGCVVDCNSGQVWNPDKKKCECASWECDGNIDVVEDCKEKSVSCPKSGKDTCFGNWSSDFCSCSCDSYKSVGSPKCRPHPGNPELSVNRSAGCWCTVSSNDDGPQEKGEYGRPYCEKGMIDYDSCSCKELDDSSKDEIEECRGTPEKPRNTVWFGSSHRTKACSCGCSEGCSDGKTAEEACGDLDGEYSWTGEAPGDSRECSCQACGGNSGDIDLNDDGYGDSCVDDNPETAEGTPNWSGPLGAEKSDGTKVSPCTCYCPLTEEDCPCGIEDCACVAADSCGECEISDGKCGCEANPTCEDDPEGDPGDEPDGDPDGDPEGDPAGDPDGDPYGDPGGPGGPGGPGENCNPEIEDCPCNPEVEDCGDPDPSPSPRECSRSDETEESCAERGRDYDGGGCCGDCKDKDRCYVNRDGNCSCYCPYSLPAQEECAEAGGTWKGYPDCGCEPCKPDCDKCDSVGPKCACIPPDRDCGECSYYDSFSCGCEPDPFCDPTGGGGDGTANGDNS